MTTASTRKSPRRKNRRRSITNLRPGRICTTLAAATRAIPITAAGHLDVQPWRGDPMTTASARKPPRENRRIAPHAVHSGAAHLEGEEEMEE
jgi:hypothetical protein